MKCFCFMMLIGMECCISSVQADDGEDAVTHLFELSDNPQALLQGEGGLAVDAAVLMYFAKDEARREAIPNESHLGSDFHNLGPAGDTRSTPTLPAHVPWKTPNFA